MLSVRHRFGQATFAGASRNGQDAPTAAIDTMGSGLPGST
jgi:hypothetical protein